MKRKPLPKGALKHIKRQGADGNSEEAKRKWLHHGLKTLHKALKKAKAFEIKKIIRRAVESKAKVASGEVSAPELLKLQDQVAAAKQLDLGVLAHQIVNQSGLGVALPPYQTATGAAPAAPSPATAIVGVRVARASCVRTAVDQLQKQFSAKFPDTLPQSNEEVGGLSADSAQPSSSSSEGDDDMGGDEGDEAPLGVVIDDEITGEAAPVAVAEVHDGVALEALHKLNARASLRGPAVDDDAGSDTNSGVINDAEMSGASDAEDDRLPGGNAPGANAGDPTAVPHASDDELGVQSVHPAGQRTQRDGTCAAGSTGRVSDGVADGSGDVHSSDFDSEAYEMECGLLGSGRDDGSGGGATASSAPVAPGLDGGQESAHKFKGALGREAVAGRTASGSVTGVRAGAPGRQLQPNSGVAGRSAAAAVVKGGTPSASKPLTAMGNPVAKGTASALGTAAGGVKKKVVEKKKKNRLGQHARQRLSEQLHGGAAKHLKAAPPAKGRAQAVATGRTTPAPGRSARDTSSRQPTAGAASVATEALHPSWAAKRQAQQKLLATAPTGTKVVFDDDDGARVVKAGKAAAAGGTTHAAPPRGGRTAAAVPLRSASSSGRPGGIAQASPRGQRPALGGQARPPGQQRLPPVSSSKLRSPAGKAAPVVPAGLHASWAAKLQQRQQQPLLSQATGKKTVFD